MYVRRSRLNFISSLAIIVSSLVVAPVGAAEIAPVPVTGKVEWVYDYAEGKELARSNGKPMFVVFRCER